MPEKALPSANETFGDTTLWNMRLSAYSVELTISISGQIIEYFGYSFFAVNWNRAKLLQLKNRNGNYNLILTNFHLNPDLNLDYYILYNL